MSRVGGAAQTKAMKKAVGTLRLDLAQYREMEVFTQFSSDLDDDTKQQLVYGQSLMRILRQGRAIRTARQNRLSCSSPRSAISSSNSPSIGSVRSTQSC